MKYRDEAEYLQAMIDESDARQGGAVEFRILPSMQWASRQRLAEYPVVPPRRPRVRLSSPCPCGAVDGYGHRMRFGRCCGASPVTPERTGT